MTTYRTEEHPHQLSARKNIIRAAAFLVAVFLVYAGIGRYQQTQGQTTVTGEGTPHRIAKWVPFVPPALVITSCSGSPSSVQAGSFVDWIASVTGGTGTYTYLWSGDAPLGGNTSNPVSVQYSTAGTKSGSITVTSGAQQTTAPCGTVAVTAGILSFTANPDLIDPGGVSTLSWTTTGFTSCTISANPPTEGIGSVPVNGTHDVTPQVSTRYTLTCNPGNQSATADVNINGLPTVIEVPP